MFISPNRGPDDEKAKLRRKLAKLKKAIKFGLPFSAEALDQFQTQETDSSRPDHVPNDLIKADIRPKALLSFRESVTDDFRKLPQRYIRNWLGYNMYKHIKDPNNCSDAVKATLKKFEDIDIF